MRDYFAGASCARLSAAALVLAAAFTVSGGLSAKQGAGAAGSPITLIDAAKAADATAVRALVAAGADINAAQSDGATALHWAAYREDFATAAPT